MLCARCHQLVPDDAARCPRCGELLENTTGHDRRAGAPTFTVGTEILGRYQVEILLGEGGMSAVYQVLDCKLGRRVALKVLNVELSRDAKARERLVREANALAQLHHPHVIQIHDVLELDGALALALELCTGGTLASLVARGPLPPAHAVAVMDRVLDGLAAIHGAGLIHRDLKPSNVLLTADGQPKIADLGIARDPNAPVLTAPGSVIGTPAYMSPEQIRAVELGPESDVYSSAVILFELLSGCVPFDGARDRDVLAAHLSAPPPLERLPGDTPAELRDVIARALEKQPERRFRSASSMRAALRPPRDPGPDPAPGLALAAGFGAANSADAHGAVARRAPADLGSGLREGDWIGEYRVRRLVGEGGMGRVYEAEERLTGRRVALKVLRSEIARSEVGRRLFLTEMGVLAGLDHPNIVRSLACTEVGGDLLMVLELLAGQTLRERLTTGGSLDWRAAASVSLQIASALDRAHSMAPPVVHRDLKPENVMLLPDGTVKVMDFGIAKVLDAVSRTATLSIGTLAYLTPEQIDARGVEPRSDLYGLGLLLYEMLAGVPPFTAESARELLNRQCTEPPPPLPATVTATMPPPLLALLAQLLEKTPTARPATARTVIAGLAPHATAPAGFVAPTPPTRLPNGARAKPTSTHEGQRPVEVPLLLAIGIIGVLSTCAGVATLAARLATAPAPAASAASGDPKGARTTSGEPQ
ncbi:MAG: serine/threonine protein kinase [Polyangiaceae bacterium]|nr:serine/threonine protein kinase [Polyangiaceae bacterium]